MVEKEDNVMHPVRCLILPADPGFLVIPSASVAEIVPLSLGDMSTEGSLLGVMAWRGVDVPVYSMEGMTGHSIPEFGKRSKALVFYPWKGSEKNKFFAIATMHDPRPRLLSSDDIEANENEQDENNFISASFLYDGELALIPDLKEISLQR